jgi:hypothetical protein
MFKPRPKEEGQSEFWVATDRLPKATPSRFYELLNATLEEMKFAEQVWEICAFAYADAAKGGRPGIDPVIYFKMLMVGFRLRRVARILCRCGVFLVIDWTRRRLIIPACRSSGSDWGASALSRYSLWSWPLCASTDCSEAVIWASIPA